MNFFSGWFLAPNFTFKTYTTEDFNKIKSNTLPNHFSVYIVTEEFFLNNSATLVSPFVIVGELKPKNLYPTDPSGKQFIFIAPKDEPKKIGFEKPGKAHIASHTGAILAHALQSLASKFDNSLNFTLSFSDDLKLLLEGEQHEFLIGLLQKSISNKVFKKSNKLNNILIGLQEPFFTQAILQRAYALSDAMCYTRTFVNMPANILNPETYEVFIRSLVKYECEQAENPNHIQIEIMNFNKLQQEECGLICAVGKGSQILPRLIKLSYCSNHNCAEISHVSLVGKGITFDSGGYDIKPPSGMKIMKKDMGGSAAALGVFLACARMQLPLKLTCWLPLAENMISGNAMRPGDVYKAKNGLQVEIDNTDAEGRLILADTLCLACDEKPNWLIDFATLTGAARVSLGTMIDSLFGNDQSTTQLLFQSGIETGDWVWPMPLPTEYESYLESSISDLQNSGSSGFAGSITAALFLKKFITQTNWNHIDTYMWCDKPNGLWSEGGGASGKCVRLVTHAIASFISQAKNLQ